MPNESTSDGEQPASDKTVVDISIECTDSSTRDDATPMTTSVEGRKNVTIIIFLNITVTRHSVPFIA